MILEFTHLGLKARAHHGTLNELPSGRVVYSELVAWISGKQHLLRTRLDPTVGEVHYPDVLPFALAAQEIEFDLGPAGALRVMRLDLPARLTRDHLRNYEWTAMTRVYIPHRFALNSPDDLDLIYHRQLSTWRFEDCLERISPEYRKELAVAYAASVNAKQLSEA